MKISMPAAEELSDLSNSESLRRDIEILRENRHNPFIKDGKPDIEAFLEFVTSFNEFINHRPKPFKPMRDREMKL
jgi:hypothetical protein